jgi:hypothetical protein
LIGFPGLIIGFADYWFHKQFELVLDVVLSLIGGIA